MYMKNKTERLYIRVSKAEMDYLDSISKTMGMSKSEVVRACIGKLMGAKQIYEHKQAY